MPASSVEWVYHAATRPENDTWWYPSCGAGDDAIDVGVSACGHWTLYSGLSGQRKGKADTVEEAKAQALVAWVKAKMEAR